MNRSITPHRKVAFASVPLAEIKAAKNALGVTVNDIVLARHRRRAAQLPDRPRRAARSLARRRDPDEHPRRGRARARQPGLGDVRVAAGRDREPARRASRRSRRSTTGWKQVHEVVDTADARGLGRRRRAGGVLPGDPALRPAPARRAHAARDQPHRVERARPAVPALPRGRPARRLHPLGPDPRRLRPEPHGDVVPRPRRLRLHRVPRARARRRRARRRGPRRARARS